MTFHWINNQYEVTLWSSGNFEKEPPTISYGTMDRYGGTGATEPVEQWLKGPYYSLVEEWLTPQQFSELIGKIPIILTPCFLPLLDNLKKSEDVESWPGGFISHWKKIRGHGKKTWHWQSNPLGILLSGGEWSLTFVNDSLDSCRYTLRGLPWSSETIVRIRTIFDWFYHWNLWERRWPGQPDEYIFNPPEKAFKKDGPPSDWYLIWASMKWGSSFNGAKLEASIDAYENCNIHYHEWHLDNIL
ncbi:MAG: hypothetical protein CVV49_19180 [Spirochaetae bacterium HGW-Spirochaetae-5]|nr:MAG: hypothetical protein CVV49_19180 [Spirochaetae bacterium HGW-Spirochaetae-5]